MRILEKIHKTPLMFDGGMGSMFYDHGVFINTCYDGLNLTSAELVKEIHMGYVEAGVDVVETNTFGANRIKLGHHGLGDQVVAVNEAGARLAREAAGADLFVAGSVGPCLTTNQLWQEANEDEIRSAFEEQIQALAAGGVDVILLETFVHVDELNLAASVARATGLPVVASFSTSAQGETILGGSVAAVASGLDANENIDILGINCGVGPALAYDAAEQIIPVVSKPVLVMPNAGMPKDIDGRLMYLCSPEYFTEYAKKFIELGARGVGGCCGTTPEHIRVAAKAIRTLSSVKKHVQVVAYEPDNTEVDVVPPEEKSVFARKILAGEKVTSIELLPPRGCDLSGILQRSTLCKEHGIDAINIPDGPRASSRVSPMITAMSIQEQVGIEAILHYCCRDRNLIGMQADLMGAEVAGVKNILIITGDPPKLGDYPDATGVFDVEAIGLTQVTSNLNKGRDIGGGKVNPPTGIFIGVGANPCAVSLDHEISRYYGKIDAGAEFAITQPIFDVDALFHFLDKVETYEKTIPVVAGVWPLISFKNAEFMNNEVPGVEVPGHVLERMSKCTTKEEGIQTGIDIAKDIVEQIHDRVAGFQVSAPFGRVEIALKVLGRPV